MVTMSEFRVIFRIVCSVCKPGWRMFAISCDITSGNRLAKAGNRLPEEMSCSRDSLRARRRMRRVSRTASGSAVGGTGAEKSRVSASVVTKSRAPGLRRALYPAAVLGFLQGAEELPQG